MAKRQPMDPKTWRLTMQYRHRMGFVYELENSEAKLSFHISQDGPPPDCNWCIGAHAGAPGSDAVVSESAKTPSEALRKVESAWTERASCLGLASLDWAGITRALVAVRAL